MQTGLISSMIPDHVKTRVPVVGEVNISLPSGGSLTLYNDGNDTIASRLYWLGFNSFEPETIRLLYQLLPHIRTFFDIGANTGLMSLLAALHDLQCQVHAFEPVPWIVDALRKNISVNRLSNIVIQPVALTDFDGSVDLYIPMDVSFPTGSSTVAGYREASQVIKVRAERLDTYIAQQEPKDLDLIKIDTETTEPAVLAGGITTLKRFAPVIICEVQPGRTEQKLHAVLDPLGYEYFHITDSGLIRHDRIAGDQTGAHLNYLFVPASRKHQLSALLGI